MPTVSDVILQSLKKAGVIGAGQTASAEDMNDAFLDFQDMLAQWQRQRWLVWNLTDVSKVSTGAQSYTVGTGGDFDVARPDRIEAAFLRQTIQSVPNQVDFPLTILESREDYNRIALKKLVSLSYSVFYDSAYPTGVLYPWPVPNASIYEIHITVKTQLGALTSFNQVLNMPPEYIAAIKWNLAIRYREAYQLEPRPALVGLAKSSLNIIRNANTQIPVLVMPRGIVGQGVYNIFSDQSQ